MDAETRAFVRLNLVPGLGPGRILSLLERAGSVREILRASPALWEDAGVSPQTAARAACAETDRLASSEVEEVVRRGIAVITVRSPEYPPALRDIPLPPPVLYVRGDPRRLADPALAVVGSRDATGYGRSMARRFASGVAAAGYVVVSGLARGIDSEAHRAALDAGGRTVAILGSGLAVHSSTEDPALPERIAETGALVSEFPLSMPARKGHYPRRNRLISGLSRGVLVVEAAERSGSLLTAQWALDQNRVVLAVPGRADNPMAVGANRLLAAGAALVLDVADVLSQVRGDEGAPRPEPGDLLPLLGAEGATLDEIARAAGRAPEDLLEELLRLELAGWIRLAPGGVYRRLRDTAPISGTRGRRSRAST